MPDTSDSLLCLSGSSATRRGSVALFLAAASLAAGGGALSGSSVQAMQLPSQPTPQLLAQATQECIPIGEGENCTKPRRRKGKSLLPAEADATPVPTEPAAKGEVMPSQPAKPAN